MLFQVLTLHVANSYPEKTMNFVEQIRFLTAESKKYKMFDFKGCTQISKICQHELSTSFQAMHWFQGPVAFYLCKTSLD